MASKISINKVFRTIIWPRKRTLLIGLLLIIIGRLSGLVLPGASKYLMDDVVDKNYDRFFIILLLIAVAVTVQSITSFLLTRLLGIEAHRLIASLRVDVQKKVLSLPIRFFDNHKSGELVQRIMSDVDGIRNIVGTGLVQLIGGTLTSIVALIMLIRISPELTFYTIFPILLVGFIFLKSFKFIRPIFRKRREANARVQGRLTETLSGIGIIKGYNAEAHETAVFNEGVYKIFSYVKKSMTAQALVTSSSTFLIGITSAAILGISGHYIIKGDMSFGDFLSFSLYLGFLIAPIIQMSNIGSQLTDAFSGLDRVEELMNMQSEGEEAERTVNLESMKGHLVFKDVHFSYDQGEEVLRGINIDAKPGSVIALVGSSGAGKSTIASLVSSQLNPTSGTITMDGIDLKKITLCSYRSQLGLVLQDDFLFEGSIRDNILFTRPNASEDELINAVEAAYVNEFTDRFEKGLDTIVGERGVKLSGGQRQRVSIARAILSNPKILILDEATSSLDVESEMMIQQSLSKLISGRTTLVIAHRLSTIRQANQILVVEQGQIIERGTHDELIAKKGKYNDLFTLQAKI